MQGTADFWRDGLKRWRIPQWTAFLVSAGAALGYAWLLTQDVSYRIALDYAGDLGLPNWRLYRGAADIRAFAAHLGPGAHAYGVVLGLGNGLASLVVATFLSLAWLAWRRVPAWSSALGAATLLYAVTDWTALAQLSACIGAAESAPYALAAFTVTAKSWLFILLCVMGGVVLALALGTCRAWWTALFMDLPYLIDRGWRRLEFRLNQEFVNEPGPAFRARRFWQVPPFWLFAWTLLFTAYGPTPRGVCSIEPDTVANGLAVFALGAALMLVYVFFRMSAPRVYRHVYWASLDEVPGADLGERRYISCVILTAAVASFFVIALWAARTMYVTAQGDLCEDMQASGASLARLVLCAAALAFYAVVWSREPRTAPLLRLQAILIVAVAVVTGLLGGADATEASGRPYLHLFLALAPATCVVLWLALSVAERSFRRDLAPFRSRFRARLRDTELFVAPPRPVPPTAERVLHGLLFQVAKRFFELTMLPAMVAVIAPRQWLIEMTLVAFLMAFAVSTWGNMSERWEQLGRFLERWFLTGTAFFVSLFVIVLAAARLRGVSYVTTLLDAAPFGVIFAGVVMAYLLSWLVEYWINRSAAGELLELLGDTQGRSRIDYSFEGVAAPRVQPGNRAVAYQAIGRLSVMGKLEGGGLVAFHSYGLSEIFHKLAGETLKAEAEEIGRKLQLYFYKVNALLAAGVLGLGLSYGYFYYFAEQVPVVSAPAAVDEAKLADLADSLLERPGDARPAIVVAASGGGTRAALYTSHVLEALHTIGADRDIKLASGVSGGGVALAYFVAHFRRLAREDDRAAQRWEKFRTAAAENFVQDVLGGASEWRIFGPSPLTVLLAESFERHLFNDTRRKTFDDLADSPALILNTTLTGHPAEESALLSRTLDQPAQGRGCAEATRPYKNLEGGRLIFTNLRQVGEFPAGAGAAADVRLPYTIVRGSGIRLADAAALNANFPPVFPNARVLVKGAAGGECADRSWFVTDGGVVENLGLVSALYAVKSALRAISDKCAKQPRNSWCVRKVRPIHFILIEASASGYDYSQDRGLSALSGGKERMAGAATSLLVDQVNTLYSQLRKARSATEGVRFHFVGLPLAYRARGGFGTHWTHPDPIELSDPRARTMPLPALLSPLEHATMSRLDVARAWTALLATDVPYCEGRGLGTVQANTVLRWICGDRGDPRGPRDLTVANWQQLVKELRTTPPQP